MTSIGNGGKNVSLSRRQVEGLIAEGGVIVLIGRMVLKLDAWLKYHPGGDKSIFHVVGKDATDEINSFHSDETKNLMKQYQIGILQGPWENFVPPIQGGKFRPLTGGLEESEIDLAKSLASGEALTSLTNVDSHDSVVSQRRSFSKNDKLEHSSESTKPCTNRDKRPTMSHIDARTKEEVKLDKMKYPSLDSVTQEQIAAKYRLLYHKIQETGLYDCNYSAYAIEAVRITLIFSMVLLSIRYGCYTIGAVFLGLFWHQLVFIAHDAGHLAITHDYNIDTGIGMIIANHIGGLSLGWWKRSHNIHHIMTNAPEHDPDIQHLPFFAISTKFFKSLTSTYYDRLMSYDAIAKVLLPYQAYYYYLVLAFGRFNLYVLTWEYLLLGLGPKKGRAWWHRWFELSGQIFFWIWFGYGMIYKAIPTPWSRFTFVMISHMITMPLHVQFTLSHFAMSTTDLGPTESFGQKMLRTTMDIDCPQWLDFLHGGLQYQAIHHLFPRVPRHNLRRTQKLVQEFCLETGIPYALYGFIDGNKEVLGQLEQIGRQVAIMDKCRQTIVEKAHFEF